MKALRENIIDKGAKILNSEKTYRRGDYSSQIDVMISNRPDKISSIHQLDDMDSDHSALILNRKMNIKQCEERFIKIRNFKNIENTDMNEIIMNHTEYKNIFTTKGSNNIAKLIKKIINESFNEIIPINKIKINDNDNMANNKIVKDPQLTEE